MATAITHPPPEAPVILALHGFTGCGADFALLRQHLPGLWHTPDLPGHGSRGAAPEVEYGLESLDTLLPGPTARPLVGIGYSLGGRLLLHLARRHPGRFASLVLVGASAGLETEAEREARRRTDEALAHRVEAVGAATFLREWAAQPLIATQAAIPEPWRGELRRNRMGNDAFGLARSLRLHGTGALPPLHQDLGRIAIPTLVLAGEEDTKFSMIGRDLASRLPRGTFHPVKGAGHAAHLEASAACAALIREFLLATDEFGL